MELLQVFDKELNELDESVVRDKKRELPFGKYFAIVLIFIENSKGEFLIQKTSVEKNSIFATTGGHVSFGNSFKRTAILEIREELGVDINEDELEYVGFITEKKVHMVEYYLKKDIDIDSCILQEEEVESVSWMSINEINELIKKEEFRSTNVAGLRMLLEYKNS